MAVINNLFLLFMISLIIFSTEAVSSSQMFKYGPANGDTTVNVHGLFANTSLFDSYAVLTIPPQFASFRMLGADLGRTVYVNYNGHITLGNDYNSSTPIPLNKTGRNIFAAYFSDNDLRRVNGLLHYRFTTSSSDLSFANNIIRNGRFTTFAALYCIVATWEDVKYYSRSLTQRNHPNFQQENTYQLGLCTDGIDGHAIFHYNKLEWSKNTDTSKHATAGWYIPSSTHEDKYYPLKDSGTAAIMTTLLLGSNVTPGIPGRWIRSIKTDNRCTGKAEGLNSLNCTSYYSCCSGAVTKISSCPGNLVYHPASKHCVESKFYNCNATNFCDSKSDGRYENADTSRTDDFYFCTKQLTRVLTCPSGISFNTGIARCSA